MAFDCPLFYSQEMSVNFSVHRTHHNQYSPMSKMEVAEDNEPSLSKVDVVLTFTLEVSFTILCLSYWQRTFYFFVTPRVFSGALS